MVKMEIKNSIFPEEKEQFPWDDEALQAFKKLIRDQGIKCCMDDIFLLGILRARKFEMGRSMEMLKNYYEVRLQYSQYFKNLLPSKVEQALNLNANIPLPQPDQKGRFVFIFQFGKWDTSLADVNDIFRAGMLFLDLQLTLHRTQEKKIVLICDSSGISLSHFLQLSPSIINSMVKVLFKNAYQIRYDEIHYVNVNIIIKALVSILLPLLSSKLRQRIHVHSDITTLHEFVSPECLPSEYGGTLRDFDPNEANKMLTSNEDFFRKNEEYLKLYEEERKKNFTQGKFRLIGEEEDEKLKKFIEQSEENFKAHADDPEAFLAALRKDSEFEITHF